MVLLNQPHLWPWQQQQLGIVQLWATNNGQVQVRYICDIHYYLQHFATLIEQNILIDSNNCFNSLSIRQRSKDL